MSAIAGVLTRESQNGAEAWVRVMLARQRHRAPDGEALLQSGPLSLGFGALHTTPEAQAERLPLRCSDSGLCLVGDIRLDDPSELSATLGLSGGPARGDGELVLEAYKRWGAGCVEHLVGDFAFALWDPSKGELSLVRDHFGVRQLVYRVEADRACFATEVGALQADRARGSELSREKLGDFMVGVLEGADLTSTFLEGVKRVPAGSWVTIHSDLRVRSHTYWTLTEQEPLVLRDEREYLDAFEEAFRRAVRSRMRAVEAPAVLLSGGVDSSAITAVAAQESALPSHSLVALSAVERAPQADTETTYIDAVLKHLDLPAIRVEPEHAGELLEAPEVLFRDPDSLFDTRMTLPRMLYAAAAQKGVRVALDGVFGDNLLEINAQRYAQWLLSRGQLRQAVSISRATARRSLMKGAAFWLAPKALSGRVSRKRLMKELGFLLDVSGLQLSGMARSRWLMRLWGVIPTSNPGDHPRHIQLAALAPEILSPAQERYDRSAARHGIEVRHPFTDKRLVELCLSLPPSESHRQGQSRWNVRRLMRDWLPAEVADRPKGEHLGPVFNRGKSVAQLEDALRGGLPPISNELLDLNRLRAEGHMGWPLDYARADAISMITWERIQRSGESARKS